MPSIKIREFPADNQPWRIDWIGRIFYMPDDEFRVRIHISRLDPAAPKAKALHNTSLAGYEQKQYDHRSIDLKIGFIQLLKIGSVWINGEPQLNFRAIEKTFEIEDVSMLEMVSLPDAGSVKDAFGWHTILTNRQYRVAENVRLGSYVVMVYRHPEYKQIIIPSTVIFQSCYVTSPKAASKIIFGQLDKLIDLQQSGFINGTDKVFRVHIHKDFTNTEGVMLANLAMGRVASKNLNALRQNCVIRNNAVEDTKRAVSIRVGFPFTGPTKLKVLGKVLVYETDDKKRELGFFVSEIVSVVAKFPFDSILPVRKNDGTKGKTQAEELQSAFGGVTPNSIDANEPFLLTEEDVTHYLKDTQINHPAVVDISHIKIIENEKEHQRYANMPFHSRDGSNEAIGSGVGSGNKRHITTGASQANVSLAPVKLDAFFEVIQQLVSQGLAIEVLSVCRSVQGEKGIINYFPPKIQGCYSWHLTADKSRPRTFVVAQVYLSGQYYYLIDVEAKNTGVLSIAFLHTWDKQPIHTKKLEGFMRDVARENGWSVLKKNVIYEKNWVFKAVDHNRKGDSIKVAKNILKLLK